MLPICYGIEYEAKSTSGSNCEIWEIPVGGSFNSADYECINYTMGTVPKSYTKVRLSIQFNVSGLLPITNWMSGVCNQITDVIQKAAANFVMVSNPQLNQNLSTSQMITVLEQAGPLLLVTVSVDSNVTLVEYHYKLNGAPTGVGNDMGVRNNIANSAALALKNIPIVASNSTPVNVTAGLAIISMIPTAVTTPGCVGAGSSTTAPASGSTISPNNTGTTVVASSAQGGYTTMMKGLIAFLAAMWV